MEEQALQASPNLNYIAGIAEISFFSLSYLNNSTIKFDSKYYQLTKSLLLKYFLVHLEQK